jgi:hypothetical protein
MIHYHGFRGLRAEHCLSAFGAGHAFISFHSEDRDWVTEAAKGICQSFALDNGAFSAWRSGKPIKNWNPYYQWVSDMARLPGCDFAVIPDVIEGNEKDNDELLREWPLPRIGAPVWHMHSSLERLERLVHEYPRVCLGSSGQFADVGSPKWWNRMNEAMRVACDLDGYPKTKLHGLRMLNPEVFTLLPLASADSTNLVRNTNMEAGWKGTYLPPNGTIRAQVLRSRIESHNGAPRWVKQSIQEDLFA